MYFISYDVSCPKRLNKIRRLLKGYGSHQHYSVFLCDMTNKERLVFQIQAEKILNLKEDRVLLLDSGTVNNDIFKKIHNIGRAVEKDFNNNVCTVV